VMLIGDARAPILSMAVSDDARLLVVLDHHGGERGTLSSFALEGGYRQFSSVPVQATEEAWLCQALAPDRPEPLAALWNGKGMQLLDGIRLLPVGREHFTDREPVPVTGLLLAHAGATDPLVGTLLLDEAGICYRPDARTTWVRLDWRLKPPGHTALKQPLVCWLRTGPGSLEVAVLGAGGGTPFWVDLSIQDCEVRINGLAVVAFPSATALQIVNTGLLAAVNAAGVKWLRRVGKSLQVVRETNVSLPQAVACYPYHSGNELIVVAVDGSVVRVPGLGG
jgi:hypothetical protein